VLPLLPSYLLLWQLPPRASRPIFQNLAGPKERANLERNSKKYISKTNAYFKKRIEK
jgi:hypothetical protein